MKKKTFKVHTYVIDISPSKRGYLSLTEAKEAAKKETKKLYKNPGYLAGFITSNNLTEDQFFKEIVWFSSVSVTDKGVK